jgi:hypothetical protein
MTTQMNTTPTLFGKDAKAVIEEISRIPTTEQRKQLREKYRKMFEGIKKKNFRDLYDIEENEDENEI